MFLRTLNTCRGEMPKTRGGSWYGRHRKRERNGWVVHRVGFVDAGPGLWSGKPLDRRDARRTMSAGLS